jgi:hypothetical protein
MGFRALICQLVIAFADHGSSDPDRGGFQIDVVPMKGAQLTATGTVTTASRRKRCKIAVLLLRLLDQLGDDFRLRNRELMAVHSRRAGPRHQAGGNPAPTDGLVQQSVEESVDVVNALSAEWTSVGPPPSLKVRVEGVDISSPDRSDLRSAESRQNALFEQSVILVQRRR